MREGPGRQAGWPGGRVGTHHAVQEVEGPQPDGLVLVVQALQDKILVRLHGLGVRPQDLGHGQEPQVLHCRDSAELSEVDEVRSARPGLQPHPKPPGPRRPTSHGHQAHLAAHLKQPNALSSRLGHRPRPAAARL